MNGFIRHAVDVTEDWLTSGSYELVAAGDAAPARVGLKPFPDPENLNVKA